MAAHSMQPYTVEYAKSGRASCKGCKGSIEKESLRIAIMVQSRHHDGRDPHWYHPDCFFEKKKLSLNVGDFSNFGGIRYSDQQFLTKKIGGGSSNSNGSGSAKKMIGEFSCEYAKSGRSTCAGCDEAIEKDIVRISKLDHESESALLLSRAIPRWYHVPCFTKLAEQLGFSGGVDQITGFKSLAKEDQRILLLEFKNSLGSNKRKLSEDVAGPSKPAKAIKPEPGSADEGKLKMQLDALFKLRDKLSKHLQNGRLKIKDLTEFMRYNKQELPVPCGQQVLLDQVSDIMMFGRLAPCSVCKEGQYVYVGAAGVGYRCNGNISEYTKCMNTTTVPLRKKIGIPPDWAVYMKNIKYKFVDVQDRIIPPSLQSSVPAQSSTLFPKLNKKPLSGLVFVLSGDELKNEKNLKDQILHFGGKVQATVTPLITAVIGKPGTGGEKELQDLPAEKKAVKLSIPVISTQFVDGLSEVVDIVELMKTSLLGTHYEPEDLKSRFVEKIKPENKRSAAERRLELKREKTARVQLKGGCVVDDDCEVARETHVYKDHSGLMYSVVLNNSNVDTGKNSYYKMQLLERDHGKGYFVFRAYGRIGTTIGKKITSHMMDLDEALETFNNAFSLQTGNKFGKPFVKKPNMYMLLDVHYADEEEVQRASIQTAKNSKLQLAVQELVCLIFDVEKMKQTMMEFELDLEKLPLGKISRKQIMVAYGILNDTLKILEKPEKAAFERQLVDVTNRFFTLIPHNFGLSQPPVLKEEAQIKDKVLMLENLLEIELAYELLREGDSKEGLPVDTHYATLQAKIEPLEKKSSEFEMIQTYLENTHAETHKEFELEIHDVFTVQRKGESTRYQEFKKLHNKMLLWHGSRTTNFAGILSQGLRIAPPEAPVTGYMFGKGIYFADMVSKSANYCNTRTGGTGLLLLCEVALGDMEELTSEKSSLLKAPTGKHSVKGLGQTTPDPKAFYQQKNGVVVPYGKPVKTDTRSSLLYNEYIVYNAAQVNIRYLVRVKFSAPKSRR